METNLSKIIAGRNTNNKNCIIVFTGETGAGKTYSAIDLAEKCDENFGIDNVFLTIEELIDYIIDKDGGTMVLDDAGVELFSRNWQSKSNKMLSIIAQSFRYKKINLFFTVPSIGMLEKNAYRLSHYLVDIQGWGHGKLFKTIDFRLGDDTKFSPLGNITFEHPSKALAIAYEDKKKAFLDNKYRAFQKELKENKK
jgi:hypothetical protein